MVSRTSFKFSSDGAAKNTIKRKVEKVLAEDLSDKGPIFKIHKDLLKLNSKKMNKLIEKWAKDLNTHLTEDV